MKALTVKSEIIKALEENRGHELSGAELSARLGVSRNAVWKAISALKTEGYPIIANHARGYTLAENSRCISSQGIALFAEKYSMPYSDSPIIFLNETDSTNNYARSLAAQGYPHGTAVIADFQNGGKGRRGRSFFSPKGCGIYLSLILRPQLTADRAVMITSAAAVAVCRTVELFTSRTPQIKWVNDVFIENKKICGILTEASTDFESRNVEYAVLGVGVNLFPSPDLPQELIEIVGAVFGEDETAVSRNEFAAALISNLLHLCSQPEPTEFMAEYRGRSMIIGEKINVIGAGGTSPATALGINDCGGLIVRFDSGEEAVLDSGEVSIRKM